MKPFMATRGPGKGSVQHNFQVLIDSDVFVGLFLPDDAHYQRVSQQFEAFEQNKTQIATTNWVIVETATVLSRKDSQETAKAFLTMTETSGIPILSISKDIEKEAWRIFKDQSTKNTSFVDCSNIAVITHFHIPQLFSFDAFYKRFDIGNLNDEELR
jgi:predicted nucleic acid-binding protein